MSTATPVTHRPSTVHRTRTRTHHMHVFRDHPRCWLWDCPCGGGLRGTTGLPTQHAALVAALYHFIRHAGE